MADYVSTQIYFTQYPSPTVNPPTTQGTLFYSRGLQRLRATDSWSTYSAGTNTNTDRSSVSIFESSGTWTNPLYAGATGNFSANTQVGMVFVFLLGGGGGGAVGVDILNESTLIPSGGSGGGCTMLVYPAIAFPEQVPVVVGAGGTGATFPTTSGASGGTSSFGSLPPRLGNFGYASGSFQTPWAGGGQGGAQATSTARFAGGMGLWLGASGSTGADSSDRAAFFYSGAAGGRGSASANLASSGGTAGLNAGGFPGGNAGTDASSGTNGAIGVDYLTNGLLRGGSGGGGGGSATTSGGTGGNGGNGGRGAGGGGGGSFVSGVGTRGSGGNGGNGYVVVISW